MILDEKSLQNPPPPYYRAPSPGLTNPEFPSADNETSTIAFGSNNPYAAYLSTRHTASRHRPSLSSLPSHLLLQIVYCTFPQEDGHFEGDVKVVRQRQTLHWLVTSLRLVNRELYVACMHILRSTYLSTYDSLIRPPYSSDPFPSSNSIPTYSSHSRSFSTSSTNPRSSTLFPQHRELQTLDKFITVLAHEELFLDATSLHLARQEKTTDIFELMQPRSRLEDLLAKQGGKAGLITLEDGHSVPSTPVTPQTPSMDMEKGKENSPYTFTPPPDSFPSSPYASSSALATPLKPRLSTFSLFSAFSKGKGKGKASVSAQPALPSPPRPLPLTPLPFSSLSVSFSTRRIGLVYAPSPSPASKSSLTVNGGSSALYGGSTYGALGVSHNSHGRKRTILEVPRDRNEALEVTAMKLVRGLRDYMEDS